MLLLNLHLSTRNVALEEAIETKRKNFEDTFNFILNLRNSSENTREFITKMHAAFCPNQPICDSEDISTDKRGDVINELDPALLIGDKIVKLGDLSARLGLCCMPCDCSESCEMKGNCCPSKASIDHQRDVSELHFDCVQASSQGYISSANNKVPYYYMVSHCFGDRTNETVLKNCESPSFYTTDDLHPVTSLKTGHTYWNGPCATCNADSDELLPWNTYAGIARPIVYFNDHFHYPDSVEKLKRLTANDLIFSPPYTMDAEQCLQEEAVSSCDTPSEMFDNDSSFLLEMCNDYYSPVSTFHTGRRTGYRNIFCFFCTRFQFFTLWKTTKHICNKDETKFTDKGIAALLDYKRPDTKLIQQTLKDQGHKAGNCECHEIYDFTKVCYRKKVQVGKDQEKAQSEKDSHSKNRGGKKLN